MLGIQRRISNTFYVLLSLPATAMGFALSIQIAALSWILGTQYDLDIHEIGIVWAAGPLAGILGQVIIGIISDRVWFWGGRRRPFILIGGVLAALMLIALPNIHVISERLGFGGILGVAIAVALTLDLAINISFNPTRSIIADVTQDGIPRTKGYTWMQTISGFFGVAAYAVGATLGNYVLIYAGAVVVLLFSLLPPLFIEEPRTLGAGETKTDEQIQTQTNWGQLLRIYAAHSFSWLGIQTMFVYIIAWITQKLSPGTDFATGQIISISFLVLNTVGFILPVTVLEPLSERLGRVRVHTLAVAVMSAAYALIVLFPWDNMLLYAFMALAGVGWAAVVSLPFAIMSENVDKSRMGFFMGMFNLSVVIPQLVVSLGLGIIILHTEDKSLIFIIAAASLAISALLWLLVREPGPSRTEMSTD
jgi:maltose/moltooligosaccharide transporter